MLCPAWQENMRQQGMGSKQDEMLLQGGNQEWWLRIQQQIEALQAEAKRARYACAEATPKSQAKPRNRDVRLTDRFAELERHVREALNG